MKLHELKPAEGSKQAPKRKGRGIGSVAMVQETAKQLVRDTKVRKLVLVAARALHSKVVRHHYSVVCQKEDLQMQCSK